jgi:hypothetical protein
VTGYSYGADTNNDYVTVAYEAATGVQRWVARYTGPAYEDDRAYALGLSANGSIVFVTGQRSGDYATVAYDAASGQRTGAARGMGGTAYDLAVSADGAQLYITGTAEGPLSLDYGTVAYAVA